MVHVKTDPPTYTYADDEYILIQLGHFFRWLQGLDDLVLVSLGIPAGRRRVSKIYISRGWKHTFQQGVAAEVGVELNEQI